MADNSNKMTLEEKIVQRLKDDTLMALVGDEDAITTLVERAIREALFQPIRIVTPGFSTRIEERDSVVVSTARDIAKQYAEQIAQTIVTELMADPENRRRIHNAMIDLLPAAIGRQLDHHLGILTTTTTQNTINSLYEMKLIGSESR